MGSLRRLARFALMLASVWGVVVGVAPPAGAHGVSGVGADNYRTELRAVTPAPPGVEVEVVEAGSRLQLTNDASTDVVVVGYTDEPYLRVGPDGVFRNRRSPATYLNADRNGRRPIPAEADATAAPVWERVSSGHVARWHDHRTHWMSPERPPAVRADPGRRQLVQEWNVPLRQGDTALTVSGTLEWVPGPSPWPWLLLAAGLGLAAFGALVAAGGSRGRGPGRGTGRGSGAVPTPSEPRSGWLVTALLVGALVVIDVVHTVGVSEALRAPLATKVGRALHDNPLSLFAWVSGAAAVLLLRRRAPAGQYAALITALVVALVGGVGDRRFLSSSTLPFAYADVRGRARVTASVGLGFGVAAGILLTAPRTAGAALTPGPAADEGDVEALSGE
jgi:hypothetical protein